MFSTDIQSALPGNINPINSVMSDNDIVWGIYYQNHLFFLLEKKNGNGILFGKIQMMIFHNHTGVYFIMEQFPSIFLHQ